MATDSGVMPGVINVPSTKMKAPAPAANGSKGMPAGSINPMVPTGSFTGNTQSKPL